MSLRTALFLGMLVVPLLSDARAEVPDALRVGRAGHAFDHVGAINEQAEAAAASGATIIYAAGLGALGYEGLPSAAEFAKQVDAAAEYNRRAKQRGIELSIGYLCATSIVGLESFDDEWSDDFHRQFETPPAQWRQQDRNGAPLPSWYGGGYHPACMNHPDWRAYEKFMVRQTLQSGHDGVFFDNPTVHPQGCYCEHCMKQFAAFLRADLATAPLVAKSPSEAVDAMRTIAVSHPQEFQRFRATIGRDFLQEMRQWARSLSPEALITCNNSLNSPDRLYGQSRVHGYNIFELSKAEDYVVVEDMVTQPRVTAEGRTYEYGPTYKLLHAISHGKPIVAVTLAGDDYHTAPNLVRLAMAEAAAHQASYLSWPTWPEEQRQRMVASIRPQADLLREQQPLLNDVRFRDEVVLFLPFRRWTETEHCRAAELAAELTRANVQYRVISEAGFTLPGGADGRPILLVESRGVFTPREAEQVAAFEAGGGRVVSAEGAEWLVNVQALLDRPAVKVLSAPLVRAVVYDQPRRTIVHLYNLNVERVNSFEDKVTPAMNVRCEVRVRFQEVHEVAVNSVDTSATSGRLEFEKTPNADGAALSFVMPRLEVSAIVVINEAN